MLSHTIFMTLQLCELNDFNIQIFLKKIKHNNHLFQTAALSFTLLQYLYTIQLVLSLPTPYQHADHLLITLRTVHSSTSSISSPQVRERKEICVAIKTIQRTSNQLSKHAASRPTNVFKLISTSHCSNCPKNQKPNSI